MGKVRLRERNFEITSKLKILAKKETESRKVKSSAEISYMNMM